MSVREVRIWRRSDARQTPAIMLEKNGIDGALMLQNGSIAALDSAAAEVEKRGYTKVMDSYGLMGVLRITRGEHVLVVVTGVLSVGQLYGADIVKIISCELISLRAVGSVEFLDPRIVDLQRLLSSGIFYYSANPRYDITSCAQRRCATKESDSRFFWNRTLHFPFERFGIDSCQWLLKCIVGSVLVRTVYVGHRTGRVALLSRLSCERVGTRFNVRGANSLGFVANFVETEQVLVFDEGECSLVQIRGSVPLFWEQPGLQVGSHKVKLRAFEASGSAYHRHMSRLKSIYGKVTVVNLLGRKEGERVLADAFRTQHKSSKLADSIEFIDFDYHYHMKISKESLHHFTRKLAPIVKNDSMHLASDGVARSQQTGVLRVNCLDCLDRTNSVQTAVGLLAVRDQVAALELEKGKLNISQRIEEILRDLWQKNGDLCSNIYAGTGALDGKSKLKDASRSIARTIQNNLMDSSKQESFDIFLSGAFFSSPSFDRAVNLLPTPILQDDYYFYECDEAVEQVVSRASEMTTLNRIKIFIGTWNVNGGKNMHNIAFRNQSNMADWIFPNGTLVSVDSVDEAPEIIAIGLEELVDLNASNLVKASTTNQRLWAEGIRRVLQEHGSYILLVVEQLVGVCLFIFVRPQLVPFIKDFAVSSVKTGMGGATGNKGSVAFRMVVHSTSICFVCSHFAAGQNEVRDRNEDYTSAFRRIKFPHGREIDSHDIVFWFGDFNYRINLTGDDVKKAVHCEDLERLWPYDQLLQQKAQGMVFHNFQEGKLLFPPTYKYDTFSDDYDTSEKCRAPAWTDRVLWREWPEPRNLKLIRYFRSELKTSDHRPVGAVFSLDVYRVDQAKCLQLVEDIVASLVQAAGAL
ncbi:Synaptojanin-1 [Trichostrongylus colubriformis]|uniref:phosphoinositide 5-phosphatase n=1 Tax=Trichostrongylus colubriformis TaxID=6319 RepID=A0AAN8F5A6_TRICO